jgi:hypothetical protein
VLEHLPPEQGALAGIRLDVIRLREAPALFRGKMEISGGEILGGSSELEGKGRGRAAD